MPRNVLHIMGRTMFRIFSEHELAIYRFAVFHLLDSSGPEPPSIYDLWGEFFKNRPQKDLYGNDVNVEFLAYLAALYAERLIGT